MVTGGDGPLLLVVHGWPQTWYAWRLVMPALARDFAVIAPDQRGCGLSGKPQHGYDTGALADNLVALMDALGHRRFRRGRARHRHVDRLRPGRRPPDRIARVAVAEAAMPGVSASPPLFGSTAANNQLCHFAFNRLAEVNDQLAAGREHVYFGFQTLPGYAVRHYVDALATDPEALHASFAIYRALDVARPFQLLCSSAP